MAPAAQASSSALPIDLPSIVSEQAVTYTPNVVKGPFSQDKTTQVWGYVPMNGVMYACGDFQEVKSADGYSTYARSNLFAFDPMTGQVSDFAPVVDGPVYTCAAGSDGQHIYIGGAFRSVNGQPATNLAELDVTTGQVDSTFSASTNGMVTDLQVVGGRLLASGSFSTIDGLAHAAFASLDPTTGAIDPYLNFDIAGRVASNSGPTRVYRFAISPNGYNGVAIGNFTSVDGVQHAQAFRFTLGATPSLVTWDNPDFYVICGATGNMPVWIRDVQFSPRGNYFVMDGTGGRGGQLCDTASRWETSATGADVTPTWINHTCVDTLHSVAVTSRAVYVQGHQKCVMGKNGHQVPRYGIAALDPSTGVARFWRSDQSREIGGKYLMVTDSAIQPGFPTGLWSGCDCGPEGGVIFRPVSN